MGKDINLIAGKNEQQEKEKKRIKLFRGIAFLCLLVVLVLSVIIFIFNLSFSTDSIKKDQTSAINSIAALSKRSGRLMAIDERLNDISNILAKRKNYSQIISEILKKAPSDVKTTSIEVGKDGVSIYVSSASLVPLNDFLNNLLEMSINKQVISNLSLTGLTADEKTGKYSLSLKMTLL